MRSEHGYFHLNLDGQAAYDGKWSYAGDYREGSAVVHREGQATHVDRTGNLLHSQWFLDLDVFHKGLARARDSDGWMHIDEQGHPKHQSRKREPAHATPNYRMVRNSNSTSIIV